MDFLSKIQDLQQKIAVTKENFSNIEMESSTGGGAITITITADKEIKEIKLVDGLLAEGDKDQVEELLLVAINKAINMAEDRAKKELEQVTGGMMPDLPF